MGFSLGAFITLQTLKILKRYYMHGCFKAGRIIHDVCLWGGAAVLSPNGIMNEITKRFFHCNLVTGRLSNCYSLKDYVLKYMYMPAVSPKMEPIGLSLIF